METVNTQTILNAGAALADIREIDSSSEFVVIPDDYKVEPLEPLANQPRRKRGFIDLENADSFTRMFNLHATDASNIYGQLTTKGASFKAVINDHAKDNPDWRDFGITYNCPLSYEWQQWTNNDGEQMSQEDFALFIERNLLDIVDPPAADMLEISRSLQATKKVNFASGVRLSNGQNELTYEEEIQGTAAKGKLQIPETFNIGVQVFINGEAYKVECRLRYRIRGKDLVMWYEMVRPHKIIEDAATATWNFIEEQTKRKVFRGSL